MYTLNSVQVVDLGTSVQLIIFMYPRSAQEKAGMNPNEFNGGKHEPRNKRSSKFETLVHTRLSKVVRATTRAWSTYSLVFPPKDIYNLVYVSV